MSKTGLLACCLVMACGRFRFDPVGEGVDDGATTNGDGAMQGVVDAPRCFGTAPDDSVCLSAPPAMPITVSGSLDTDTSPLCFFVTFATGATGCVIAGTSITVLATTVTGAKPLILVSAGTISITSTLDVSSHVGGGDGPSADASGCLGGTQPPVSGGGAGGSFGGSGGAGGEGAGGTNGGSAGGTFAPQMIRGGCPGQDGGNGGGAGGHGGGAVLLLADTLDVVGTIDASGAGGSAGTGNPAQGGGGGGSGGLIAVDATSVTGAGTILANGGGGAGGEVSGSGGATTGTAGHDPDPTMPLVPAPGGAGHVGGMVTTNGGAGATGPTTPGDGIGGDNQSGGGGGGGGVGIVHFYRATFTTGTLSP